MTLDQIRAAWQKEIQTELRAKQGLANSSLFGVMAVAAAAFATATDLPRPSLAAGLFTVILLFVATIAVPRVFLAEEEQGTFDLVRQWAPPEVLFLGKLLFANAQMALTSILLAALYAAMVPVPLANPLSYWAGALLLGLATANVLSLTSTLVLGAANRWILAIVVAMPLLFPLVFTGVGTLRYAFGEGSANSANLNLLALAAYAVLPLGLGPTIAQALWNDR